MGSKGEYCSALVGEGETRCASCGAPVTRDSDSRDFRTCPFCHRRLLALASPACNYCGRRLPEEYVKTREADLRRVVEVQGSSETTKTDRQVNRLICQAAGRQLMKQPRSSELIDTTSLIDLLS